MYDNTAAFISNLLGQTEKAVYSLLLRKNNVFISCNLDRNVKTLISFNKELGQALSFSVTDLPTRPFSHPSYFLSLNQECTQSQHYIHRLQYTPSQHVTKRLHPRDPNPTIIYISVDVEAVQDLVRFHTHGTRCIPICFSKNHHCGLPCSHLCYSNSELFELNA